VPRYLLEVYLPIPGDPRRFRRWHRVGEYDTLEEARAIRAVISEPTSLTVEHDDGQREHVDTAPRWPGLITSNDT
jgi:hypothetical protein